MPHNPSANRGHDSFVSPPDWFSKYVTSWPAFRRSRPCRRWSLCGSCGPAGSWRGRLGRFARLLAAGVDEEPACRQSLRCGQIAVPRLALQSPRRILAPPQTAPAPATPQPASCTRRMSWCSPSGESGFEFSSERSVGAMSKAACWTSTSKPAKRDESSNPDSPDGRGYENQSLGDTRTGVATKTSREGTRRLRGKARLDARWTDEA